MRDQFKYYITDQRRAEALNEVYDAVALDLLECSRTR